MRRYYVFMAGLPMYERLRLASCFLRSAPQRLPMSLKKSLLLAAEWPDQIGGIDPPTAQRLAGGLVFTNQLTASIRADRVPVKQLVHMGGEQQAVATAYSLRPGRYTPWLPRPVLVLIGLWRSGSRGCSKSKNVYGTRGWRSGCQFTRTSQPS